MKSLNNNVKKAIIGVLTALVALAAALFGLTSCGTTRATIAKPEAGSYTTITITTNNPIETNTNPNLNLTK